VAHEIDPSKAPAPPEVVEEVIPMALCPCGEPPGQFRLELAKGAKIGQIRGSCCGAWAVEFINNTDDPEQALRKAVAEWNSAPRSA
jgi:hypothetical protein